MPAAAGGAVWRVRAGVLLRAHRGKRAGRLQPVRPRRPRLDAGAPPGLAGRRAAAVRRSDTAPSPPAVAARGPAAASRKAEPRRSEEHTSELQSLMRTSYAVFCLKTKTTYKTH